MAALNVAFDDDEMDELRRVAEAEGVSMKALVHKATIHSLHERRVQTATKRTVDALAEVNKRLAEL
ncbi:hypothetical protein [Actinocatenispora thailandica]|nr:hypothetical protein [Actinocatenispora thailandica]